MRSLLIALMMSAAACGHDELDFSLPDAGMDKQGDAVSPGGPTACTGAGACRDAAAMQSGPQNTAASGGGAASPGVGAGSIAAGSAGAGSANSSASAEWSAANPQRLLDDPKGYPGTPEQKAMWCEQGLTFEEICGNDIDEDCDGTVDEFAGLGQPCHRPCGEGIYVCDPMTNVMACFACSIDVAAPCGDGFVGEGEQCDPAVPGEQVGVTCTPTCERPLFVRCIDSAGPHPELCKDELEVCSERIGACMPVIGPRQRRCPELPVEGSDGAELYPMLEVETEPKTWECWVTCSESEQCPGSLSECYMGFCAVPF